MYSGRVRGLSFYYLCVTSVADLAVGSHACARFADERHKRSVVRAYVDEGLRRGERVALYTRGTPAASLLPSAWDSGDVAALIDAGQLVLGSAEDGYFGDGKFDGAAQAAAFEAFAEEAVADGYEGLRVYADNGWMPAALDAPLDWLEYEMRISRMIRGRRLTGLCGFAASDDEALSAELLDAVHPERISSADDRPSLFHVVGDDGGLAITGELDYFGVGHLMGVLDAARPLLDEAGLSLSAVTFVDGAAASALARYIGDARLAVRDVSAPLRRLWDLLDLTSSGMAS
jgi:hypothetical protein